jgi:hypothetical protein
MLYHVTVTLVEHPSTCNAGLNYIRSSEPGVVAHAFNPSTWEAEAGEFLSSGLALVYRVSSRTARATQRNPVSKKKKKSKKKRKKEKKEKEKHLVNPIFFNLAPYYLPP